MTQVQIEHLTHEEYTFYLAHGSVNDDELQLHEQWTHILHTDVEM